MSPGPITVLVAEDHPVFLEGLVARLSVAPDMTVVATARTGTDAERLILDHGPDVAVLDIEMPERNGIEITRRLRGAAPHVAVLILTAYDDDERLEGAMDAGALGYLSKHAEPETVLEAIRTVARAAMFFDPLLTDRIRDRLRAGSQQHRPFRQLTEREHQVLALLAANCSNEAVAQRLGMSTKTARNHVSSILAKLSARDRRQAAEMAREAGMTPRPGGLPDP
ncbi:DNA-binding response regulator [Streptomyces ruber]|uniref:DNA-binding response regulator n=2 Tax=Streptomyces TaxID=1883 RepID=A0A918EWI1_9ACTN|nr:response regulator transcription factor [Streptomyces ruber]GGQ82263.1 DNA-binding response regulator [Streptomyces ruber]